MTEPIDDRDGLPELARRFYTKRVAIEPWPIDMLAQDGALEPGFKFEFEDNKDHLGPAVFRVEGGPDCVTFTIGDRVQPLKVAYTDCGTGRRPWWICPKCAGRRGVLYLRAREWSCRRCMGVPYRSQHRSPLERAASKARRLHTLLGGDGGMVRLPTERPKGMHWSTYRRLYADLERTIVRCNQLMQEHVDRIKAGPIVVVEKSSRRGARPQKRVNQSIDRPR
jgi:hypothetical protein